MSASAQAAALARKSLERLRIASRSDGVDQAQFQPTLSAATQALHLAQAAPLQLLALQSGAERFRRLAASLANSVANISATLDDASAQSQAATVAAAGTSPGSVLLALAAAPPNGRWQRLTAITAFNASAGFGWTQARGAGRSTVVSPDAQQTDALHATFIGGTDAPGSSASTLRLRLPPASKGAPGVVTLISGSYDTARQAATTAVAVSGSGSVLGPGPAVWSTPGPGFDRILYK